VEIIILTLSHIYGRGIIRKEKLDMVKVNLTQLVDDLARLTLVQKMVQEQVELKKAILKERLAKNPNAKKIIFTGKDYTILLIKRQSKRLDSKLLRETIGEKKYDAFKTKIVESVEFQPLVNDNDQEKTLIERTISRPILDVLNTANG
jgi:hypothetical protein